MNRVTALLCTLALVLSFPLFGDPPVRCATNCEIHRDGNGNTEVREIPASAFRSVEGGERPAQAARPVLRKLEKSLEETLFTRAPGELVHVVVTWHDKEKLPVLPRLKRGLPAAAEENQAVLQQRRELVDALIEKRRPSYEARERAFAARGGRVSERFWLIDGVDAVLPLSVVAELAADPDVNFIEPANRKSTPAATISTGRAVIRSNWWHHRFTIQPSFSVRIHNGWSPVQIGILDTGVRTTHTLLDGPGLWTTQQFAKVVDCDQLSSACKTAAQGGNPADDEGTHGHGTGVASIISGNADLGDANRGVTPYTFESYKVCCTGPNGSGATTFTRAFQEASLTNDVLSVSMSYGVNFNDAVSLAADAAYDTGRVVIAAVGNTSQSAVPTTPGIAHKVIAVGAVSADFPTSTVYQASGATSDGRFKPDIQGPTDVSAASRSSNTAMWTYGGTSGSTPFISAAAAMTENSFCDVYSCTAYGGSVSPFTGEVYASIIRRGDNWYGPYTVKGAGVLRMDEEYGTQGLGNVTLAPNQMVDVNVTTTTNAHHDASIGVWWPETVTQAHNNVFAHLIPPTGGGGVVNGTLSNTVWQKLYYPVNMAVGTWKLRLINYGSTTQKVFYNWFIKCDVPSYCGSFW